MINSPKQILNDVLKIDKLHRDFDKKLYEKNSDMICLDTLDFDYRQYWLYEYPTISARQSNNYVVSKSSEFRKIIKEKYQFLCNLDYSCLFIAGGFVSCILCDRPVNDIDMFIYGIEEADANNLVHDTVNEIINCMQKINRNQTYEIINSENCVSINICGIKIQIIFRLYSSKSEILHGFDVGSCAIGYDGTKVYVTSLGKFAYELGFNIIDLTRRSTTYEKRLIKYLERGFGIIMCDFDMTKLNTAYQNHNMELLIDMPYLKFAVGRVYHNDLCFTKSCTKLSNLSDYCDINIRKKIKIDDQLNISCDTFMNSSHNKYNADLTNYNHILDTVDHIIDYSEQTLHVKGKISRFINNNFVIRPKWKKINPGTQLTGSFNPIIDTPELWYGKYYKTDKKNNRFVIIFITTMLINILIFFICVYFYKLFSR